jgi:lysozyme family protein
MTIDFNRSLKFVLEHETVYAKGHYGDMDFAVTENEDNDPGGLTKFGIDQRSHPDIDIEDLTVDTASLIYKREYWEKAHCPELPWPLSQVQFDGAVNTGVVQQMKFLQRAVGVSADGLWGPNTSAMTSKAISDIGVKALCAFVCDQKEAFYRNLAKKSPITAGRWLGGWLNRLNDLRKECDLA